jgi:hypothetical protein
LKWAVINFERDQKFSFHECSFKSLIFFEVCNFSEAMPLQIAFCFSAARAVIAFRRKGNRRSSVAGVSASEERLDPTPQATMSTLRGFLGMAERFGASRFEIASEG